MECTGQHQGEEAAEARGQGDRRDRDGVAAEGRDGGRGGGGRGSARTQRGRLRGQNKEGAKKKKEERRSSGERSQLRSTPAARHPVTRAVVVGSIPTSSARRAHLKTSIVPALGRWNSCNRS